MSIPLSDQTVQDFLAVERNFRRLSSRATRMVADTVGDGVETEFNIEHDLATSDVIVQAQDLDTGSIYPSSTVAFNVVDDSTIHVIFSSAPTLARVVIIG